MNSLSLKTILTGLMATLLVAITTLSVTSLLSISAMKASTDEIGNYWFERIVTAREVKGAFADLRLAYSRHGMVSNDEEFQMESQTLNLAKQGLTAAVDKYEAGITTETGRDIMVRLEAAIQEYIEQGTDYTALVKVGNRGDARHLFEGEMQERSIYANRQIQDLVTYINERSDENLLSADKTANTAFVMVLSVATIAVIISLIGMYVASARIATPIERITDAMLKLARGDVKSIIPYAVRHDEIGKIASAVQVFRDNAIERFRLERETEDNRTMGDKERLVREEQKAIEAADVKFAVDSLAAGLEKLSEGDISYRINQPFVSSLDAVRNNFNHSAEKLQGALINVAENALGIDVGVNEIRSASDDLARRTEQQAAAVEETAAALEQITTTVKDSTKRAQDAGILVNRAKAVAEESGGVVKGAVVAMEQISQSANEINNIISVIDEIAFQTNLLALNAGVEAARAGEAGKGFAVVAQEVRELAQRSARAAKEIKELITTSNLHVNQGVQLVGNTGVALETIILEVQKINHHVSAIVVAAQEQSSGLQQINAAVTLMDQDTQKNAAMVEESTAASHNLAREAASLGHLLSLFKLTDDEYSASKTYAYAAVRHN